LSTPTSSLPGASPPSAPIEPGPPPGGCLRGGLIGCGIAALLVLVLLGGSFAYVRRHPEALTDWMMKRVESGYAPEVTPAEREHLETAYGKFRVRLQERRVPRADLDHLRGILSSSAMGSFSRDEVRELTELFERGPAPPPLTPATEATPNPTPPIPPTP
jgi:hypothetical protein